MSDAKKRDGQPQPKLFPFIIAWALGCFLASWLYILLLYELDNLPGLDRAVYVLIVNLGLFTVTSTAQFFAIRRFLYVELRGWVPLAIVGVSAGIAALELLPRLIPFKPEQQPLARFAFVFMWILPAVFQWTSLRKRFVNHWLWLLAAVIMGPVFIFVYRQGDGIFRGLLTNPEWLTLRTAALAADFVLPSIILGLVLYYTWSSVKAANRLRTSERRNNAGYFIPLVAIPVVMIAHAGLHDD